MHLYRTFGKGTMSAVSALCRAYVCQSRCFVAAAPSWHTNLSSAVGNAKLLASPRHCTTRVAGPRSRVPTHATAATGDANQQLKETAALDQFIDQLLAAKNQQQLTQLVAQNLLSCNQRFWLRIATRSDGADTQEDRDKLTALSRSVMLLVDALVKEAEGQINQGTDVLQEVLTAAAEDNGEWALPLAADKVEAMRKVMQRRAASLDEAFLGSAFAWMRKAKDDKLDGMVVLLQKVLQQYAAQHLAQSGSQGEEAAFVDKVLAADEAVWEAMIREGVKEGNVSEAAFMQELQKRMEKIVLGVNSGTYSQRVLAEYLKELEQRATNAFKQ